MVHTFTFRFYDAILQHGFLPYDPDGLPKLLRCARDEAGGTPSSGIDEKH